MIRVTIIIDLDESFWDAEECLKKYGEDALKNMLFEDGYVLLGELDKATVKFEVIKES